MTDTNKPNTPAPSSDSQPDDENATPPPSVADGPKVSPFNYINRDTTPPPKIPAPSSDLQPGGGSGTPPPSSVAGPKTSPVHIEIHSHDPSADHTELGISDSHAVDCGDSETKKGQ